MEKKIYKSTILGVSDEQFHFGNKSNYTGFIFYNDLISSSISEIIYLNKNERIQGLVFEEEGVKVYIEKIK